MPLGIIKFKQQFFREAVGNRVERISFALRRAQGAYTRTAARRSMKRGSKKRKSTPGKAPLRQVGLLHKFLYFANDPSTQSTIVGPAKLDSATSYGNIGVPELLEYGGTVVINGKRVTYKQFPYMAPAAEATIKATPKLVKTIAERMNK